jgi:hypothetical protein
MALWWNWPDSIPARLRNQFKRNFTCRSPQYEVIAGKVATDCHFEIRMNFTGSGIEE